LTLFRSTAMEYKCQSKDSYNLGDRICSDYAVVPHSRKADGTLWQQALHFQRPMIATTQEPLLPMKVEGVNVSALRHDKNAIFMRVYNGCQEPANAKIMPPPGIHFWQLTDGLMDPIGEKLPVNGAIEFSVRSFQVQGIKLFE